MAAVSMKLKGKLRSVFKTMWISWNYTINVEGVSNGGQPLAGDQAILNLNRVEKTPTF